MDAKAVIEVRGLVARYAERLVLDHVSFEVYPGEILAVVGPSGCGKTTLLKHLIGLLHPSEGSIFCWGKEVSKMDEDEHARVLQRFGLSFQSDALFNSLNVAQNVALPMEEYGRMDPELIDIIVRMKLNLVGLGSFGYLMPSELSGGMRKRVGFARAIAMDPEIVFFDEPSSGLDPITSAGLDQLILNIRRLMDVTMVVVTHKLVSIRTVADRVLMLDRGRVIFVGSVKAAETSQIPRVRQFFEERADEYIDTRDIIG